MGWIVLVVIVALIAVCLDSVFGKIVIGAAVVAIGFLLLAWITSLHFFITLAKVCAVIMVVTVTGAILIAIVGK